MAVFIGCVCNERVLRRLEEDKSPLKQDSFWVEVTVLEGDAKLLFHVESTWGGKGVTCVAVRMFSLQAELVFFEKEPISLRQFPIDTTTTWDDVVGELIEPLKKHGIVARRKTDQTPSIWMFARSVSKQNAWEELQVTPSDDQIVRSDRVRVMRFLRQQAHALKEKTNGVVIPSVVWNQTTERGDFLIRHQADENRILLFSVGVGMQKNQVLLTCDLGDLHSTWENLEKHFARFAKEILFSEVELLIAENIDA